MSGAPDDWRGAAGPSLSGIAVVSFDVGGTLIDPWPSVGHVYAEVAAECGLPRIAPELINAQFIAAWRAKTQFDYSRAAWANLVTAAFGGAVELYGIESALFPKLYDRFKDPAVWRVHPDVLPTLETLTRAGFRLAVISNWDERLRPLLSGLRLARYFSHIEVSSESGFQKPAREIFDRAALGLGVNPAAVMQVGDSQVEDFEGALGAGMRAVLLDRRGGVRGPDRISSLRELVAPEPDRNHLH